MKLQTRIIVWGTLCAASVLLYIGLFRSLWAISLEHEYASYIFFVPFMSAVLILRKRDSLSAPKRAPLIMLVPMVIGLVVGGSSSLSLSLRASGIVLMWIGGFVLLFGKESFRNLLFPVLCLFLIVPIPERLVDFAVMALQKGSAEGFSILLKLTGTPHHREGVAFILPRATVIVAPECSSIRSSLALLISCLLAGHLMLRTISRKLILVLVAVPMAMIKNAIRITTLSLLAIHVDMRFLTGNALHRKGGILFFMLALLLLIPVLWLLRKGEKRPRIKNGLYTDYDS